MIRYNPGDVILIPFPFTDFSTFKQRPAVVLSSSRFNRRSSDVIIAAISSHLSETNTYDYRLNSAEQKTAGLPQQSVIKLGKIVTIDQRLIRKCIGNIPRERMKAIFAKLFMILHES